MKQNLPAGLIDANCEFFVTANWDTFCITNGGVVEFDGFGAPMISLIEAEMQRQPAKVAALKKMTGTSDRLALIKQFIACNYGRFDNHPDIIDGVLQPAEYSPCPKRGTCKFEGIVCDNILTATGEYLTKRETEIIIMIAKGELDKGMAGKLNLKNSTIATHTRNIRRKTGLFRKPDITRYAFEKNLI